MTLLFVPLVSTNRNTPRLTNSVHCPVEQIDVHFCVTRSFGDKVGNFLANLITCCVKSWMSLAQWKWVHFCSGGEPASVFQFVGRAKLTGCYSKVISFVQTKGMIPVQTFLLSERLRKFMKTCSRKAFPINSSGRSLRARIVLFEVLSGVRKRALSLSFVGSNSWVVVMG